MLFILIPRSFYVRFFLPKTGRQKIMRHGGTGVRTTLALTSHPNAWELDEYAF